MAACRPAPDGPSQGTTEVEKTSAKEPENPVSQAELVAKVQSAKARVEAGSPFRLGAGDANFAEVAADLRQVIAQAEDLHLRANASLLLGSLFESRADLRSAISYYQQARMLLPKEASPRAVLAMALAADHQWDRAIAEQKVVVSLVPNDLQGRLIFGEILTKSGRKKEAALAYAEYEMRRKGLLDGLTLTREGAYVTDRAERAQCAGFLAHAADNGTALALMTAFGMDPDPGVRAEIVGAMGYQRLLGYRDFLRDQKTSEKDPRVLEAMNWALAEIDRDPVDSRPTAKPPAADPFQPGPIDATPKKTDVSGRSDGESTPSVAGSH